VGITDAGEQSGINGGLAVWNLILAYIGSINAERAGRRGLFLISTIGMLASYVVITGLSGSFATTNSASVGTAVVPFLFIYYGFYDVGWTPLPFSYTAEILPYHMRLKGLGILLSTQNIAQAFVSRLAIVRRRRLTPMTRTNGSTQWLLIRLDGSSKDSPLHHSMWSADLLNHSYIVYIVLQCVYLTIIIFFFPETR
jgi:hypothetical protein